MSNNLETNSNYIIFHHLGYLTNKNNIFGEGGVDLVCKIDLPSAPEQIQSSNTANYSQQTILSRSAPVYSYISSGPRTVTVNMKLHREMMDDMDYSSYSLNNSDYKSIATIRAERGSLEVLTDCLELAVVPTYTDSAMVIPPRITFKAGNIKIMGVVKSVQTTYDLPIVNDKYMTVTQNIQIEEIDPYDTATILRLGGYR